eukprot:scaffold72173_cov27-Attheya_sp.AAC.1
MLVPNADNGGVEAVVSANVDWESLIESGRERRVDMELDLNGDQINIPELDAAWLTPDELQVQARQQRERGARARHRMRRRNLRTAPDPTEEKEDLEDELVPDSESVDFIPAEAEADASEDESTVTDSLPDHANTGRPQRRTTPVKRYGE